MRTMNDDALMAAGRLRLEGLYVRYPHLRPYGGDYSPDGWAHIVADALTSIAEIEAASGLLASVAQVKEKFGGLRLYVRARDETTEGQHFAAQLQEIVAAAEQRAARTCQKCGAPGELRSAGGWWGTTCAQHAPRDG